MFQIRRQNADTRFEKLHENSIKGWEQSGSKMASLRQNILAHACERRYPGMFSQYGKYEGMQPQNF